MAFDKTTGKEIWRAFQKTRIGALGGFWSTPVFGRVDGRPCLVYLPGLAVVGLDPATGATQWKYDHVIDEHADYLRTEFRAKDPKLRVALEAELDAPGFLAQEPFYQAHRPFKSGQRWRDLPLDAKLAHVMEKRSKSAAAYLHQAEANAELLVGSANVSSAEAVQVGRDARAPRPVVVTTGTGSGKTEAFLLPVIENAWQDAARFKKPGLTAILVYPMNALANDQPGLFINL